MPVPGREVPEKYMGGVRSKFTSARSNRRTIQGGEGGHSRDGPVGRAGALVPVPGREVPGTIRFFQGLGLTRCIA